MKDRQQTDGWEILGAGIILFIIIAITSQVMGWTEKSAAWVQAIGSVMALFTAVGIALWQLRASRRARREDVAEALRAKAAVVQTAYHYLDLLHVYMHTSKEPKQRLISAFYISTKFLFEEINRIGLHDLPSQGSVEAIVIARRLAANVLTIINDNEPNVLLEHDMNVLKDNLETLHRCASNLGKEADRISTA